MFTQWKKMAATLSATALLSMSPGMVSAQDHSHSHDAGELAQLTLNDGKKWATDDNLRQGMSRIRDALAAELPAIHSGKATAEQYRALAQKTNDQIAFMVKNCKLEQKADAMLHLVLADIIAGADAMMTPDGNKARKGAEKVAGALDSYGTYFAHPGWHGVKHAH
ncbi:MAG: hypothetical protein PHG89_07410 [Gallionella sp.]|nr:hypothetical protein [Gallionella sp.]